MASSSLNYISLDTKKKVIGVVNTYIRTFRAEYEAVKTAVGMKRKMTHDQYASLDGNMEARALFEISETLNEMIFNGLTLDEYKEFSSIAGSRWFAKTYSEFALPTKI